LDSIKEDLSNIKKSMDSLIRERQFVVFTGACFSIAMLTAFVLTIIGAIDFRIIHTFEINIYHENIIRIFMFMISMFFIFSLTLKAFDKSIISILLGYIPIHMIGIAIGVYGMNEYRYYILFMTTVSPLLYCVFVELLRKTDSLSAVVVRFLALTSIMLVYQQASAYVKFNLYGIMFLNENIAISLVGSIDLWLLYILLYMGVKKYELDTTQFSIFFKSKGIRITKAKSFSEELNIQDLKKAEQFVFWVKAVTYYVLQLLVVLGIGFINNALIELSMMLITFFIGRSILNKCWHSNTLTWCSIATFSAFYVLTKVTLPISASLFASIALSSCFTYFMYRLGVYQERFEDLETYAKHTSIPRQFKCKTASESEIRKRCKEKGIKASYANILVYYYIENKSHDEIASLCHYSAGTIENYIKRYRRHIEAN